MDLELFKRERVLGRFVANIVILFTQLIYLVLAGGDLLNFFWDNALI